MPGGQAGRGECGRAPGERVQEARAGGEVFPQGVAHVQLEPVQENNLHFLYFVGFFQTVKKKKILKRENEKKKSWYMK